MIDKIIHPHKVRKVMRAIDAQILLRTQQLCKFHDLKRSLEQRMFREQLHQSDLDMVRSALRHMRK